MEEKNSKKKLSFLGKFYFGICTPRIGFGERCLCFWALGVVFFVERRRKNLDQLLEEYQFAKFVWHDFFQEFGFLVALLKNVRLMIREFLFHPLSKRRPFPWMLGRVLFCGILGEGNNSVSWCGERP